MTLSPPSSRREARADSRRRVSAVGVIGEILITAGVVVLLYVAWQLWIGDVIYGVQNNARGAALSEQWQEQYAAASPLPSQADEESPSPTDTPTTEAIPVMSPAVDAETLAVLRIPRFGDDYAPEIGGGVTRSRTLDTGRVGHYLDTEMPGEMGNFALAAHRTTYGAPFNAIGTLRVGDAIVIETEDGWYTYRFRTLEYVTPDSVDVLNDVPQAPTTPPNGRYITMTSCSPMYSMSERIVAFGVFEEFTPRSEGPPASLGSV